MASKCFILLPLFSAILQFLTTLSSYVIGTQIKENVHYLPYPSDLGVEHPERGIFSVGLCVSTGLTFSVLLFRCMQVHSFYPRVCGSINVLSFVCGVGMIIGQSIVPAFSLDENKFVHYAGAVLYFISGWLYMVTQAHISRRYPYNHTQYVITLRVVFAIIGSVCPVTYIVARIFAPKERHRYFIPQVSEWLLAMLFLVFISTFAWDFSKARVRLNSYEISPRSRKMSESLFARKDCESNM